MKYLLPTHRFATCTIVLLGALSTGCSGPKQDPVDVPTAPIDVVEIDVQEFDSPNPIIDVMTVDVPAVCFADSGPGARVCSGNCVDTLSDSQNCGACGVACLAGASCNNGMCEVRCAAGLVKCDGRCIDPRTNNAFCGASMDCEGLSAGAICARGLFCIRGVCETVCPPNQINCGGNCIDPQASPLNCGASGDCAGMNAGASCARNEVCAMGVCGANCPPGFVNCGGNCIDPQSSAPFCGANAMCNLGSYISCPAGQLCSGGRCGNSCGTGTLRCGNPPSCVEASTSRRFCGAVGDCLGVNAGRECRPSEQCLSGRCVYFEPPPSEITPYPSNGENEVVDVPRPVNFSIGGVIPGTIYYTIDGSEPRPGTGTTLSAVNIATVTIGNAGISTLRWFMDYGPVYGRESEIQQRLIRVSASAYVAPGALFESMRINNGGPTALVAPGTPMTITVQHTSWHQGPGFFCPGCAIIQFQSFDNSVASSAQFTGGSCEQDNVPPWPGQQQRPRQFTFTAPMQRGRYAIRWGTSLDFQMACPRYVGGAPIGYFYVR